jgi:Immunity protein 35
MLTFKEARQRAEKKILELAGESPGREYAILDSHVRERARGWLFPYNTTMYVQTGNPFDGVVGNGPVFVDRETGSVHVLPSGGFTYWLGEYDQTGIPPLPRTEMQWVGEGPELPFPSPRALDSRDHNDRYCANCGSPVTKEGKFCSSCGTELHADLKR